MSNKDYSLLRPFDLEAAKRGEKVIGCGGLLAVESTYVAGPSPDGSICTEKDGSFGIISAEYLRMAPLCWVEGKPIYQGDSLYLKEGSVHGRKVVFAADYNSFGFYASLESHSPSALGIDLSKLTLTPPKVKREGWVNVYRCFLARKELRRTGDLNDTREQCDLEAERSDRKPVACVRIEWEE